MDDNWSGATNTKYSVTDLTNDQMSNKTTAAELLTSEKFYEVGSWKPDEYSTPVRVYRYRTYERVGWDGLFYNLNKETLCRIKSKDISENDR